MTACRVLVRDAEPSCPHFWVAPPFDGVPTGGTLYNAALCSALSRAGASCERVDVALAAERLRAGFPGSYWVDSLYLSAVADLVGANVSGAPVRLVVHYLPSLVVRRDAVARVDVGDDERVALGAVDGCLVTSAYMRRVLGALGVSDERVAVVEPAVPADLASPANLGAERPLSAFLVANLSPAKGLRELLRSMARSSVSRAKFRLTVAGSLEMDVEYAHACRTFVTEEPGLRDRVVFAGPMPHDHVIRCMAESDVLVSASTMESYGMALAEARAVGVPILAIGGGNVDNHVERRAGGALFSDTDVLVQDLARLAQDPAELRRRAVLARSARRARSWDGAAAEFLAAFSGGAKRGEAE